MYSLLQGIRVVEAASFIAAPSCALHLAQMGAEVVRIDQIGGGPDFGRWPLSPSDGRSLYWDGLNKGKKSIAIDLGRPEGRELAIRIITAPDTETGGRAGLFVTNFPVGGFLAYDRLQKLRADLVCLRLMGWGDGRPAMDYTVNAAIGIPAMTGPVDADPVNHVLPAWDLVAGAYAAFCLVSAELKRRQTGAGCEIRLPLSDVGIAAVGNLGWIAEAQLVGERERLGNELYGAFGRDFVSADGKRLMVVAVTPKQWRGLVAMLGLDTEIAALEAELAVSFARDEGPALRPPRAPVSPVRRRLRPPERRRADRRLRSRRRDLGTVPELARRGAGRSLRVGRQPDAGRHPAWARTAISRPVRRPPSRNSIGAPPPPPRPWGAIPITCSRTCSGCPRARSGGCTMPAW